MDVYKKLLVVQLPFMKNTHRANETRTTHRTGSADRKRTNSKHDRHGSNEPRITIYC
jgi:hypothetical protein